MAKIITEEIRTDQNKTTHRYYCIDYCVNYCSDYCVDYRSDYHIEQSSQNQGKSVIWLPSVTTVISHTSKKNAIIQEWKERVGSVEAQKAIDFGLARGRRVHETLQNYVEKRSSFRPPIGIVFERIVGEVVAVEYPVAETEKFRVCGRIDYVIKDKKGTPCILDIKTTKRMKGPEDIEDYWIQTWTYANLWESETGESINKVMILMVDDAGMIKRYIQEGPEAKNMMTNQFVQMRTKYDQLGFTFS